MAHQLILPAQQIPVGSTVRKQRGTTDYVLASEMNVWRRNTKEKTRERKIEVKVEDDEVMLLAPGYAQIEDNQTELVWIASDEEFAEYISREQASA